MDNRVRKERGRGFGCRWEGGAEAFGRWEGVQRLSSLAKYKAVKEESRSYCGEEEEEGRLTFRSKDTYVHTICDVDTTFAAYIRWKKVKKLFFLSIKISICIEAVPIWRINTFQ